MDRPPGRRQPLAAWMEEFLLLARRLSPTTVQTYRRDLDRYVLPRFGEYRIGRLPADEIENWLNDEVAAGVAPSSVHRHYRTLRRVLQVAVQKQRLLAIAAGQVVVRDRGDGPVGRSVAIGPVDAGEELCLGAVGDELYLLVGDAACVFVIPAPAPADHAEVAVVASATGQLLAERRVRYREHPAPASYRGRPVRR